MKNKGVLFAVSIYLFVPHADAEADAAANRPQSLNSDFDIATNQLPLLRSQALNGDAAAAYKLYLYYELVVISHSESLFWSTVSAEDGGAQGEYSLGFYLAHRPDPEEKLRAVFWLTKARAAGVTEADDLLARLAKSRPH